ncbi:MAG: molybdenum cofactor biosynthesis protein MoaE [Bacteroidia bacterium]
MTEEKREHSFFQDGAISPETIAASIAHHSAKKNIGAHQIFLGQVREDEKNEKKIMAIQFDVYPEMAKIEIGKIREEIILKHNLTCAHVIHSRGLVGTGQICFFVFVSSPHRKAATDACTEMVERIKKEVPIFGKEIFEDDSHQWKKNN